LVRFKDEKLENAPRELQEDFLYIITVFLAKNNRKCAAENRRRIRREVEEEDKGNTQGKIDKTTNQSSSWRSCPI
jgi:hypothetical protein